MIHDMKSPVHQSAFTGRNFPVKMLLHRRDAAVKLRALRRKPVSAPPAAEAGCPQGLPAGERLLPEFSTGRISFPPLLRPMPQTDSLRRPAACGKNSKARLSAAAQKAAGAVFAVWADKCVIFRLF